MNTINFNLYKLFSYVATSKSFAEVSIDTHPRYVTFCNILFTVFPFFTFLDVSCKNHSLKNALNCTISSDVSIMGLKNPGILYFPFVERFGLLLLRFLNADLSTYESAYKDFFYAYGLEILRDVNEGDYPKENGKTCRKQGAILAYNKRLQEKSAYTEYRKLYQQQFNFVNKNKNDKQLKKDFETWKKLAKEKMTKLKHNELTEDEVYEWLETQK